MKAVIVDGYLDIRGTSAEEKPYEAVAAYDSTVNGVREVNVSEGDTFFEADTSEVFMFSNGEWVTI